MRPTVYKPKSKRRKMRSFKLEEISVVDKPAQAGAVATIMKAAGDTIMSKGESTVFDEIRKDWRAIGAKLDMIEKARRNPPRDLRNQERAASYLPDEEGEGEEYGEEFEKEPINTLRGDRKRTAADHEGDWPGQGTKGGARQRRSATRGDGFVSGDESDERTRQMTAERASDVLQPYADNEEETEEDEPRTESDELFSRLAEEEEEEMEDVAKRFSDRFPRADPYVVAKAAYHAVMDARPHMGREREIMKRHLASQPVSKTYTDAELAERLEKRFGPKAVERACAMYARR